MYWLSMCLASFESCVQKVCQISALLSTNSLSITKNAQASENLVVKEFLFTICLQVSTLVRKHKVVP